jgi:hypothetical protein
MEENVMAEINLLKEKICALRKLVEDEMLLDNNDKEKLLMLSTELDKLIYEYFLDSRKTG